MLLNVYPFFRLHLFCCAFYQLSICAGAGSADEDGRSSSHVVCQKCIAGFLHIGL